MGFLGGNGSPGKGGGYYLGLICVVLGVGGEGGDIVFSSLCLAE
jgi:hypothetical protein